MRDRAAAMMLSVIPRDKTNHVMSIHSFIYSGYFYSTSSSPLLLIGAPDTARILSRSCTPKRHRQLRVKDLSKVTRTHDPSDERHTNEQPCPISPTIPGTITRIRLDDSLSRLTTVLSGQTVKSYSGDGDKHQ